MHLLISVIIPVYNPILETFEQTLNSVLRQTWNNLEILVIDDGSDIDIYPTIKNTNDHRIFYDKIEHSNANVARNHGIKKSKGNFIAMLDADDIWLENHLEDCYNTISKNEVDGLYGSLFIGAINNPFIVRPLKNSETMIDYLLSTGFGAQTSTLFLSQLSAKSVIWDTSLNRHQDYDFVIRYSKKYTIIPKNNPTVIYSLTNKALSIDFNSCIRFICDNRNDISSHLYYRYSIKMLQLAKRQKANSKIISYYIKEIIKYTKYTSFDLYIKLLQPKTKIKKFTVK